MEISGCENPFKPGAGSAPPLLAGRAKEARLLAKALRLLQGPRVKNKKRSLQHIALPVIQVVGPCGAGKTALLSWMERRAKEQGIRSASFRFDEGPAGEERMAKLLACMKEARSVLRRLAASVDSVRLGGLGTIELGRDPREDSFHRVLGGLVAEGPFLLLLDDAQNFDSARLAEVLFASDLLIRDGRPLAVVIAGKPGLERVLMKDAQVYYQDRQEIHLGALNDEAAREALRAPFEQAGVAVTPAALEAMAAQADNYPPFIQLVGKEVWDAMARAGRKDVDAALVRHASRRARKGREAIYEQIHERLADGCLLPYARQAIELIENRGGKAGAGAVLELIKSNPGVDHDQALEIREGLREDGAIWSIRRETRPGIPSFFDYFKARCYRR